jgi:AmmeMemoRadiSam system protein A
VATCPAFLPILARAALMALLLSAGACNARTETSRPEPPRRVREPAVAGLFYPGEEQALAKAVDALLERAPAHRFSRLRGLVCPHAGYAFSGQTAAIGYKTLVGREIQTVIVMGPSHYAFLEGACIPDAQAYRTPLGLMPISEKAQGLARTPPFGLEKPCPVQRPAWWAQGPKPAPERGQDTPETWEHSVEVQVPFLQRVAGHAKLLPVVLGEVDPERVAKALAAVLDDKTIVVASSDLSHYHTYDAAKELDSRCIQAICSMNTDDMKGQEACGKTPILALMHLAKIKGWKAQLLDCRNSGDATGEKDRVVGYCSVAFIEPAAESTTASDRKFLLELARRTLTTVAANPASTGPELDLKSVSPKLAKKKACFVTLTKAGVLRGCIGHILPKEALCQAVIDNARNAALLDPRFDAVRPDEVGQIKIEISVLTEPQPLAFDSPDDLLNKLKPHQDGVLLRIGERGATFLPQVWEQLPDKVQFLDHLSEKAGCPPGAWRGKETSVSIYHVECFEENGVADAK